MPYKISAVKEATEVGPDGKIGWHAAGQFWPKTGRFVEEVPAGLETDPMIKIKEMTQPKSEESTLSSSGNEEGGNSDEEDGNPDDGDDNGAENQE